MAPKKVANCATGTGNGGGSPTALGDGVCKQQSKLLDLALYMCLQGDEKKTWMCESPFALCVTVSCHVRSQEAGKSGWVKMFLGSEDCDDKDGARLVVELARIIVKKLDPDHPTAQRCLIEWISTKKLAAVTTDGASAMRSTQEYEGLQSNPEGTSFAALVNQHQADSPGKGNL